LAIEKKMKEGKIKYPYTFLVTYLNHALYRNLANFLDFVFFFFEYWRFVFQKIVFSKLQNFTPVKKKEKKKGYLLVLFKKKKKKAINKLCLYFLIFFFVLCSFPNPFPLLYFFLSIGDFFFKRSLNLQQFLFSKLQNFTPVKIF